MLKKLRNKIAIITGVFLVLQLASLGAGSAGVFAAPGDTTNTAVVSDLQLVSAFNHNTIFGDITDGSSINVSGDHYSILASTTPADLGNGSVVFNLDGAATNVDFPTLNAKTGLDNYVFNPATLATGSHTLIVTPWSLTDGQGYAGTAMSATFTVTDNPTVLPDAIYANNITVSDPDNGNTFNIPVRFSQKMDETSTPMLYISNGAELSASPYGTSLTYTGKWVWNKEYRFTVTMHDVNVSLPATHLTINGAVGADGSPQIAFTTTGLYTVDTLNPTATLLTLSPTNLQTIPVVLEFSKPVSGFDPNNLVIANGTMTDYYDQGNSQTYGFNIVPTDLTKVQDITVTLLNQNLITDVDQNLLTPFAPAALVYNPIPPLPVTNFTGTINGSGQPVLTWTDPVDPTSYAGLQLWRDGVYYTTLGVNDTSFTDTDVNPGSTHVYDVVVVDLAGNVTHATSPVTITAPPAVVSSNAPSNEIASAGLNDNNANISTTTPIASNQKSSNNKQKNSGSNNNDNNGFPLWGILLLVILAGVGGYLFYTQNPKPNVVPPPVKREVKRAPRNTRKK